MSSNPKFKKKVRGGKTHNRDAQEIVKQLVIELKALKISLKHPGNYASMPTKLITPK
jgi:hypothetical protein